MSKRTANKLLNIGGMLTCIVVATITIMYSYSIPNEVRYSTYQYLKPSNPKVFPAFSAVKRLELYASQTKALLAKKRLAQHERILIARALQFERHVDLELALMNRGPFKKQLSNSMLLQIKHFQCDIGNNVQRIAEHITGTKKERLVFANSSHQTPSVVAFFNNIRKLAPSETGPQMTERSKAYALRSLLVMAIWGIIGLIAFLNYVSAEADLRLYLRYNSLELGAILLLGPIGALLMILASEPDPVAKYLKRYRQKLWWKFGNQQFSHKHELIESHVDEEEARVQVEVIAILEARAKRRKEIRNVCMYFSVNAAVVCVGMFGFPVGPAILMANAHQGKTQKKKQKKREIASALIVIAETDLKGTLAGLLRTEISSNPKGNGLEFIGMAIPVTQKPGTLKLGAGYRFGALNKNHFGILGVGSLQLGPSPTGKFDFELRTQVLHNIGPLNMKLYIFTFPFLWPDTNNNINFGIGWWAQYGTQLAKFLYLGAISKGAISLRAPPQAEIGMFIKLAFFLAATYYGTRGWSFEINAVIPLPTIKY